MHVIYDPATGIIHGLAATERQAAEGRSVARDCLGLRCATQPIDAARAAELLASVTLHPVPALTAEAS